MRKIALPEGEKVLAGPSRSCKYPDDASYEIGNAFRFHTRNGEGLAERVAEIIRTKTPFMLNEQINRQNLRRPVDKMYEGAILPAETQKIVAAAGDLFLGRSIVGEYGGMLYWTKNSLGDLPCTYPRLKPAKDLVEAQANFYKQVKEFGDKERQLGCGPLLGVCSAMIFPPLKNKVYDKFILEMMPGDPERLSSAIRGASRAYSKKEFYTLIAHGWYGGGLWDDLYFKRLRNAMNYAYIAGFKAIFSESGHFGFNGYGNKVERSDAEAARFRKEMSDFLQFCETDRRPLGGPDTPVAFLRGNLDGFPGLWASCVWGQFDDPAFANGDAEYGWELTKAVYTKRPWFDNMLRGNIDNSGQAPCGMYDIIPPDVPQEQLKRYKFVMIPGWNTMNDELYAKLKKYVEDGGTLLMSLAQMRSNIKRNEALKLYKNGDFSDLFGVSLDQHKTIRVNGLKFTATDSFDGRLLWPDWTLYADPKFSESDFQAASVKSSAARVIAQASNNFEGDTLDKPEEKVPVLFEYRLGKGRAFLINSMEFPGSRNMFNFNRVVMSELMRAFQPADCQIECSTNIRYAVYGKPIPGCAANSAAANKTVFYVMNTDYDFDGFFKLNGKTYQIKPQELRRIELDQK